MITGIVGAESVGADLRGVNNVTGVDPMLGPLADNGGDASENEDEAE